MNDLEKIRDAVIKGDDHEIEALVDAALAAGTPADKILSEAMLPAMQEVGRLMEEEEYYLPDVLISVRTAHLASAKLRPLIVGDSAVASAGTVILGSVEGDIHDIGKNLVGMMFEGVGFKVIDVGINVPAARFVDAVKQEKADILALSALLNNTKPRMSEVIGALKSAGVRDQVLVMVGGAPVTSEYAAEIGADGYASDAGGAARVAKQLMGERG